MRAIESGVEPRAVAELGAAARKRSYIPLRVNAADVVPEYLAHVKRAVLVEGQPYRLREGGFARGAVIAARVPVSRQRRHSIIEQVYYPHAVVIRIGHEEELAVAGEREGRRGVEPRVPGHAVREARNSVARERLHDILPDAPDNVVARVRDVDGPIGRDQNVVGQAEIGVEQAAASETINPKPGAVEILLPVFVRYEVEATGESLDGHSAARPDNAAYDVVAVLRDVDRPARVNGDPVRE